MRFRWLAAFSLSLFALSVAAATLDRLRAFVRDTQTARAQFTQTVYDKAGNATKEARGMFLIERPGKFRWVVLTPYKQLLVGDGERVWIYDEDLNQVIAKKNDQALGTTPAALLAGRQEVEAAFEWHDLPAKDGLDWLAAVPKNNESTFSEIRLGFKERDLAAIELYDRFGQRTVIKLTALERNPKLSPSEFQFTPPKGADVITD